MQPITMAEEVKKETKQESLDKKESDSQTETT